jgi:hypothetical protein
MFTGETFEGKADFSTDGITVTPDHGGATKVDLPNVQDAVFAQAPPESMGMLPPGVFLGNGSFIAGQVATPDGTAFVSAHGGHPRKKPIPGAVTAFDEPAVKLGASGISVPGSAIAQVMFVPMQRDKLPSISGRTGAILPNGDFITGTIDGMIGGRLQVNSLLFGAQQLTPRSQVAGAVLGDIQYAAGNYEIVTKDGSRFLTNDPKFDHDGVSFTDSIAGSVKIKTEDLIEIRAGAWRYQSLAEATPARVQPPPGVSATNAFMAQTTGPAAADATPSVLSTANTMVTYMLPPGFTVFVCSVALSKDSPPAAHLAFDVYADGRLIFGSAIVGAGSAPAPVRVNLGQARMITLRAEPEGPGSNGATGRWIYPLLMRP